MRGLDPKLVKFSAQNPNKWDVQNFPIIYLFSKSLVVEISDTELAPGGAKTFPICQNALEALLKN